MRAKMPSPSPLRGSFATPPRVGIPIHQCLASLIQIVAPNPDPLSRHAITDCNSNAEISESIDAVIPELTPEVGFLSSTGREDFEDFATSLYEWLSLVRLQSPRIQVGDQTDPYLSRYHVPDGGKEGKLCKISWQGFLAPAWSRQALIDIVTALPHKAWFSFSTTTFSKGLAGDNAECTILRPPNSSGEYLMWEVKGHE
jgi:ribonuclease P/MRP protein subunit RPP40